MKKLLLVISLFSISSIWSQIITVNNSDQIVILRDSFNNLPNDTAILDLNSDGKNDILFTIPNGKFQNGSNLFETRLPGYYLPFNMTDSNLAIAHFNSTYSLALADTLTDTSYICENRFYNDTAGVLAVWFNGLNFSYTQRDGEFRKNNYLGIKFHDSQGAIYYGRIKLSVSLNCDTITVHSWDYQSNGNCINVAGISEINKKINLDYIITNKMMNINNINGANSLYYHIFNINGSLIQNGVIKKNDRINLSNLKSNMYIINFSDENGNLLSNKFIILD